MNEAFREPPLWPSLRRYREHSSLKPPANTAEVAPIKKEVFGAVKSQYNSGAKSEVGDGIQNTDMSPVEIREEIPSPLTASSMTSAPTTSDISNVPDTPFGFVKRLAS